MLLLILEKHILFLIIKGNYESGMTDKELKKLSRLELLELLLEESRENEKLRNELENLKAENSVVKSARHLNEASEKMNESLHSAAELTDTLNRLIAGKIIISDNQDTEKTTAGQEADKKEETTASESYESAKEEITTQNKNDKPSEKTDNSTYKASADVHIYTRLLSYFHKNRYALAFIPEDIKNDIEKRLDEITKKKAN